MATAPPEDRVLRTIVEAVEAETGDGFFRSLVRHLASALDVRYAFASEFTEDRKAFRTLAVWGRGAYLPNLVVPLAGTPCEAVLSGSATHHADGLQELFPADRGLVDWGVVSYCGVPLVDRSGTVRGHFAILDDRPMPDPARGFAVLRIFAARVVAELERARVEAALRESEARYRDLYEAAPVAYMSFDVEGRLIRWNRRAEELTGYGPEQLRGVHFLDLGADSAAGKPQQQALYERFLAGEETVSELEGRRRDGGAFWIRSHVRPLRDASGAVTATQSVLVDITDRKRAEEALRESEERLSRVLSSAMDAIVTIDDAGRVELFNAAAEKVLGAPAGSAVGRPFATFLTPPLAAEIDRARAASSSYAWLPAGLRARRADRREFPVEGTISRVSVGGRRLHTLILRDVEERMRAEEQLKTLHSENVYLREEIEAFHHFDEIIGESPALQAVLRKIGLVAGTDSSVLILGETGTGKELVARAVHSNSRRRSRPLIKVNCAALPTGLVESELFGHEKGAFTGAHERRIGRFELADGGTIFLDEIGELSPEVQVKLLRVLQERQLERIGGTRTLDVDVRVIAATNRDLARAVTEGTFRQDLYYRLNVFPVVVPPLRERPEDIPLLVHYFVERYAAKIGRRIARVAPEAMRRLVRYAWPGNVRELENVVERAVILATGPELDVAAELLPGSAAAPPTAIAAPPAADDPASLEHVERSHIVAVLKRTNWRVDGPQGAARILDINPSTLRSRMQKLGIRRGAEELS